MNWFKRLFRKRLVIEVKAPYQPLRWDKATKDAVATLQAHPGFIALCRKIALQKSALETRLLRVQMKDLREVDFLQSGIAWLGFLEQQTKEAVRVDEAPRRLSAMDEEMEAFKQLDSMIERVGME